MLVKEHDFRYSGVGAKKTYEILKDILKESGNTELIIDTPDGKIICTEMEDNLSVEFDGNNGEAWEIPSVTYENDKCAFFAHDKSNIFKYKRFDFSEEELKSIATPSIELEGWIWF